MHQEIFRALEDGATVITAGRRLARVMAREFHSMQAGRGRVVWNRPDVLPLDAYLERAWSEWLGTYADDSTPVLLTAEQEQIAWEHVIRDSPAGASLLQIPETARQAMETWRWIVACRLPVDGSFEASEDWSAFASWAREFERRCRKHQWLERARLPDLLRDTIARGEIQVPAALHVAGFDEVTPQQRDLFHTLGDRRAIEIRYDSPSIDRRKLRDVSEEIRSAARWARSLLGSEPATQIGIIVAPDLTRVRAQFERILREVLGEADAFHVSIGPALAEYPMISAALRMLELAQGRSTLPHAGMLLRCPFVAGSEKEWTKRAQLDARLRNNGVWDLSIGALRAEAANCPLLQRVLRRVEKMAPSLPEQRWPSDWSRNAEAVLEAFGWPGDRMLSSLEHQTIARWRELLASFAALDAIAAPMTFQQVVDWLRNQAASTRFQIEDEGAPVQVMGTLEAVGLKFDHVWIMGLHDEAVPAPANPNPFIPTSMQRRFELPHSSAERELEFAAKLMERLVGCAPDVVLSYPEKDGDRVLSPSPLVTGPWRAELADGPRISEWIIRMRASAVFEKLIDDVAPALAHSDSTGGASLFKDMAACPFRAFAKHRLSARPLEEPDLGLSYRDRGSTIHAALESVWRELESHARLVTMTAAELDLLIANAADAAVKKVGPGIGRDLEKLRVQRLVTEWLEIERARSDFFVAGIEAERLANVGGLQVRVRADRVDSLPGGGHIIVDYKTGRLIPRGWDGDRPEEPQLPLYCATADQPVAGAVFALIRTGDLQFKGLTARDATLPCLKPMTIEPELAFEQQVVEWRRVLERIAEDYRAGKAEVDPKPGACEHCGLRALCRIREFEAEVQ